MMRVTIEIVPYGLEKEKYLIRTYDIGNIGHLSHMNPHICRYAVWELVENGPREHREPEFYVWHDRDDGPDVLVERVLARLRTGKEGAAELPGVHPTRGRDGVPARARQLAEAEAA